MEDGSQLFLIGVDWISFGGRDRTSARSRFGGRAEGKSLPAGQGFCTCFDTAHVCPECHVICRNIIQYSLINGLTKSAGMFFFFFFFPLLC